MKSKKKNSRLLNYSNRFLIGLIIALASVHLAFEWESERIEYIIDVPDFEDPNFMDDEVIQITYPEVPKMPEPKANTDQIEVVDQIIDRIEDPKDESKNEPFNPEDYYVDLGDFGDEKLEAESHPTPIYSSQFPHTPNCAGLTNKASEDCSRQEIARMIRKRMNIPPILKDIGEKQGVLVEFTVNKEGHITDVEVLQSTHTIMSREAKSAINRLPQLSPATQNELPVSMRMSVPIVLDFRK
jgi:protein TonB